MVREQSTSLTRVAFIPDVHAPYHDPKAWAIAMRAIRHFCPEHIGILGDFGDFYGISSFDKSPSRRYSMADEVGVCNRLLDQVSALEAKSVTFVEGNHEDRLTRYIARHAAALHGLIPDVRALFRLQDRGWGFCAYRNYYKVGKLNVTHDVNRHGRFALHQSLDIAGDNLLIGHTHRLGYVVERTLLGHPHLAISGGWLGDYKAIDYQHQAQSRFWQHGFVVGYMEPKTGYVHLQPVAIFAGRCVVNGEVIR